MDINKLLNDYLDHLEIERGRSIKTRENYSRYLHNFINTTGIKNPDDITQNLILEYRLTLNRRKDRNGNNLDTKTQNYYIIAVRSFLRYLIKRDIRTLSPDKVELAKQSARKVSFLEKDELQRLLETPNTTTLKGLRDKTILELLFSTGLRVSELCKLNREDIDLNKNSFSVIGKGKQIRMVFLSPASKQCISHYLTKRQDIDEALFIRLNIKPQQEDKSLRLSTRSIQNIVRSYSVRAGLTKKVTPHTLRHSFGTDLLINGADIRSVQELLGHKNISTTQIYTHVTNKRLEDTFKKYHSKGSD